MIVYRDQVCHEYRVCDGYELEISCTIAILMPIYTDFADHDTIMTHRVLVILVFFQKMLVIQYKMYQDKEITTKHVKSRSSDRNKSIIEINQPKHLIWKSKKTMI